MPNFIILDEEHNNRKDMYGGPLGNLRHGLPVITSGAIPNISMKPIVRHVKLHHFERRTQEDRCVWWTTREPGTRITGGHTRGHSQYIHETDCATCQISSFWTKNPIREKICMVNQSKTCVTDYRWSHPGPLPI